MNAPIPINAMAGRIPPAPVLAVLANYRREDIEAFIAIAIDLLDLADGDPDNEEDDPSGQCDEDGISTAFDTIRYQNGSKGAGCTISDPDRCADDDGEGGPLEPDRVNPTGMQ